MLVQPVPTHYRKRILKDWHEHSKRHFCKPFWTGACQDTYVFWGVRMTWYLPWLDKWHDCCVAERLGDKFRVNNIIQLIMEVVHQILAVIVFVVKYMFAVFDRRLLSSSLTLIQLSLSGRRSRHQVMAGWWMCFLAWRWINFHNIINSMTEPLAYTLTRTNTRVSCTIGGAKGLRISPFCYY